ncbi:MAG: tandem-95 repeat protein, partial [Bacteroidetes bacterium]|nr:tandem-95 repeat protein [Bacteroidota bacterium]
MLRKFSGKPSLSNFACQFRSFLLVLLVSGLSFSGLSQPGKDGSLTISVTNTVLNRYSRVTASITAGNTTLTVQDINDLNRDGITYLPSGFVSNASGFAANPLSPGDLIMIYQAQGATIATSNSISYGAVTNYNSAGAYELAYVESVSGNTITVCSGLVNNYSATGYIQVVRIPQFSTLTINASGSVVAIPWGNAAFGGADASAAARRRGGLVAATANNLVNNGLVAANSAGFRGGTLENNTSGAGNSFYSDFVTNSSNLSAEKGESIAGFQTEYDLLGGRYGRGAPANGGGGGNAHNAAGGGGANGGLPSNWVRGAGVMNDFGGTCGNPGAWALDPEYIANGNALTNSAGGGKGGYTYASSNQNACVLGPSYPANFISAGVPASNVLNTAWNGDQRDVAGGLGGRPVQSSNLESQMFFGGGGGAGDGNNTANSNGGNGGGIVFLVVMNNISGTGTISANGQNGPNTAPSHNDAPGGGGGGGSVLIQVSTIPASITVNANGGAGGTQLITGSESEGPGGGGGGGVIAVNAISDSSVKNVNGGANGRSNSSSVTEFLANGATSGSTGDIVSAALSLNNAVCNFAPLAVDDVASTPEETAVSGNVASNDSDVDGPSVDITLVSGPANGLFSLVADGSYTYTPNADFVGTDTVSYSYCDLGTPNLCDFAILVITVTAVNDAPVAVDDVASTPEETAVSGNVASNDLDVDGPSVDITLLSGPSNGLFSLGADGSYTYTPNADFVGTDTVSYSYCDLGTPNLCDTAILVITVTAVNDAPVAVDDVASTPEETAVSGNVASNDSDVDGPSVDITLLSGPANGLFSLSADGSYTYTPNVGFNGLDTVVYSYCDLGTPNLCDVAILVITVTAVNDAPVAVDDVASTPEETAVSGNVASNDSDVDGPSVDITLLSGPSNGLFSLVADGSYTYTPNADFVGTDTVSYSYCDLGTPNLCDTAILIITVTAVNDAPVALNDVASTPEETAVSGNVASNDSDVDGPSVDITLLSGPANGLFALGADGSYTYTPNADFVGTDTVSYSYCDLGTPNLCDVAVLVITITAVNDAPVAVDDVITLDEDGSVSGSVATNDSDTDGPSVIITTVSGPSNGSLTLNADGSFTYTPDPDFFGTDTVTYSYCDGGLPNLCDTAILVITVNPINDAPVAVDDVASTPEETAVSGNVASNDSDVDGPSLDITLLSGPSNGLFSLNADGSYTYTPNVGFNGLDTMVYSYCDLGSPNLCDTAILVVIVGSTNDAPIAVDDVITLDEDGSVSGSVATNDSDSDGPSVIITTVSGPSNGSLTLNADGSFTYTPDPYFFGTDTVTYSYC